MDPKFVKEHAEQILQNETIRGGEPDLIIEITQLYQEIVRADFLVSQLKRARNNSGPLMKGKSQDNNPQEDFSNDLWVKFQDHLSQKETVSEALRIMENLKRSGLVQLLKEIKIKLNDLETLLCDKKELIDEKCQLLGNLVPNHLHRFSTKKSYIATQENPNILAENSPLLGTGHQEPNVRFEMNWEPNQNYSERVLYLSDTPAHLYDLEKSQLSLKGHQELTSDLGLVEYHFSGKIAGNRGYSFINQGVQLNRALINYALDFLSQRGYSLIEPPHMMKFGALKGVTQLNDFQETLYPVGKEVDAEPDENKFLIATSEQPLTAFYRDQLIRSKELPIRNGGVSHCYRKEAGSHGQDTLGIFRVHQFEKVEQFSICDPEKSWDEMARMIQIAAEFYDTLGLKYRIINVASNDINNSAALKYDLEGYFPHSQKYRELVSCTNCTDYIAKKIHCRTDQHKYPHFLNSTLCANTRVLCCLLETYQNPETGTVEIPNVLVPYMSGITFLQSELKKEDEK